MTKSIILVGAGGHAVSCANVLVSLQYKIAAIVSPEPPASRKFLYYPHFRTIEEAASGEASFFCLAIGHNHTRSNVAEQIIEKYGKESLPPIIHPFAHIAESAEVAPGAVVMPKAVIGAEVSIGLGCLVNTSASIDHESTMNEYSSLAPGVCTGGNILLGARSAICLGAHIVNNISVGEDAVVGASSLVLRDVSALSVWYGSPARHIRQRIPSDQYM